MKRCHNCIMQSINFKSSRGKKKQNVAFLGLNATNRILFIRVTVDPSEEDVLNPQK